MSKKSFIIILSSFIFVFIVILSAFLIIKPYKSDEENKKNTELSMYEEIFKLELNKNKIEYTIKALKKDNLSIVEIPASIDGIKVTRLEDNSDDFSSYKNITEIKISENINYIGNKEGKIFLEATGLTKITVDEKNETYSSIDGVLYSKDQKTLLKYPNSKNYNEEGINKIIISDFVEIIGRYAFYKNENLECVVIGENVTTIEMSAFSRCEKLNDIKFNQKIKVLGSNAFSYCNLDSVELPESMEKICENCFSYNKKFSKISLNSFVEIKSNCFTGTVTTNTNAGEKYRFEIIAPNNMKSVFQDYEKMVDMGFTRLKSYQLTDSSGKITYYEPYAMIIFNNEKINYNN